MKTSKTLNPNNKASNLKSSKTFNSSASSKKKAKKIKELPESYYEDLILTENTFYLTPSVDGVEKLILLYKSGSEYFSGKDKVISDCFSKELQDILMNPLTVHLFQNKDKKVNVNKKSILQAQIDMDRVDLMDFRQKSLNIIDKMNENLNSVMTLIKESEESQKLSLKRKLRRKAFKNQVSEEFSLERRSSINSIGSNKKSSFSIRKESFTGPFSESKEKREKNLADETDPDKSKIKKKNNSEELIDFFKEYHKKLYFLYQSNIESAILKLNKVVDDASRKKVERFHEYQGNLKDYLGMGESFKDLIDELKSDYSNDLKELDKIETENIQLFCENLAKNKMKENLSLSKLNMEVMVKIVNLFK